MSAMFHLMVPKLVSQLKHFIMNLIEYGKKMIIYLKNNCQTRITHYLSIKNNYIH